jgi:hypothetical protein
MMFFDQPRLTRLLLGLIKNRVAQIEIDRAAIIKGWRL